MKKSESISRLDQLSESASPHPRKKENHPMKSSRVSEEQIRVRAFGIYLQRGGQHGNDRDDWLQAEYELMQLPVRKIAELPLPNPGSGRIGRNSLVALVHLAMLSVMT